MSVIGLKGDVWLADPLGICRGKRNKSLYSDNREGKHRLCPVKDSLGGAGGTGAEGKHVCRISLMPLHLLTKFREGESDPEK